jgi:hypothetical protein
MKHRDSLGTERVRTMQAVVSERSERIVPVGSKDGGAE